MTITTNPVQTSENINLGRLKSLGILSPEFAPFLLPRKYLDLRDDQLITNFIDLPAGEKCTLYGTLGDFDVRRDSVPSRVIVRIIDNMQRVVSATFFGDPRVVLKSIEGQEGFAIFLCVIKRNLFPCFQKAKEVFHDRSGFVRAASRTL